LDLLAGVGDPSTWARGTRRACRAGRA
jgi:hypothetical protein